MPESRAIIRAATARRCAAGSCVSRLFPVLALAGWALCAAFAAPAIAQNLIAPGEAYVTRFSGTATQDGRTVIDVNGAVGGIVDLRAPGAAPRGAVWRDAPQRLPVTAGEVGQVFGVAFDTATPPNIYLAATAAFGLHRRPDNRSWMPGMWGRGGGPGTIWKLSAANGYRPQAFAQVSLGGRTNTGPALGNIAIDRWNGQLLVSDLETGMIHRLRLADGAELGRYDHGVQGRSSFTDLAAGVRRSLAPVAFDPASRARIDDCTAGSFPQHPSCWNFADFRRRVWGLAVRRDPRSGETRLYYSIWASHGFGDPAWLAADEDRRNAIWSVRIAAGGDFDPSDVRREFLLPDFFGDPAQAASLGASSPVADIAFPKSGEQAVMLLAERGGIRNLGLDAFAPFARPHESRVLRYVLDERGVWQPSGRYDVGFYDRKTDGQPYLRANAAGGVDFGFGYDGAGRIDPARADAFTWMTGDRLCAPDATCASRAGARALVDGLQGTPVGRVDEGLPRGAVAPYPAQEPATPGVTPDAAYLIDVEVGVAPPVARDDASKIGDVAVFAPALPAAPPRIVAPAGAAPDGQPAAPLPGGDAAAAPTPQDMGAAPGGEGTAAGAPAGGGAVIGPTTPQAPTGTGMVEGPTPSVAPAGAGEVIGPTSLHDLSIDKTAPQAPATAAGAGALHVCAANQPCAFTVTVTNIGGAKFEGPFRFTDTLPTGWSFAGASAGWSCTTADAAVSCTHALSLAPGQSVSMQITLNPAPGVPPQPVTAENCAEIDWSQTQKGGSKGTARSCMPVVIAPGVAGIAGIPAAPEPDEPDITIRKRPLADSCMAGGECGFLIVIEGTKAEPFAGPFTVTDIPPKDWTFGTGGKKGLWTCKTDEKGYATACDYDIKSHPAMPKDGLTSANSLGFDIIFDVPATQAEGEVKNCVIVTFPPPAAGGISKAHKTVCATVTIAHKPKLSVAKKFDKTVCRAGESCDFTITVKNEGKGPYNGFLRLWDSSDPPGLEIASASSDTWSCTTKFATAIGHFICYMGPLAPGATTTISAKAKLAASAIATSYENCAHLLLEPSDPSKLSTKDQYLLVRDFLHSKGYQTDAGDGPLTVAERQALSDYKTQQGIFADTSGDITNDFLKTLLPTFADESGKSVLVDCDKVSAFPAIKIEKVGVALMDLQAPGLPGTAVGRACQFDHDCTYTIKVSGTSQTPFADDIAVRDQLPAGWTMTGYEPKGAGQWQCTGSNTVRCTHPSAQLTAGKSLTLKIHTRPTEAWYAQIRKDGNNYPWLKNCAYLEFADPPPGGNPADYASCYQLRVVWSSDANIWNFDPIGTGSCTPPNCSFYAFTATVKEYGYKGPLSIRITPPPGSAFPQARVTRAPALCPAARWSCSKTGSDLTCRIADCSLAPGEPVEARIDGRIAPDLTQPPPVEQKRTACATLEWQVRGMVDIEQRGDKRTTSACFTTRILARAPERPKPVVCTGGRIAVGNACVCPAGRIELRGRCVACTGGKVAVGNRCVCPAGTVERRGVCRSAAEQPPPRPGQPVVCIGGTTVRGACLCPRGMTREQTGPNAFRCVPPRVQTVPTPVLQPCTGGKIRVGDRCVCPPGTIDMRGRCVRQPVIQQVPPQPARPQPGRPVIAPPKLQTIPGGIICPQGTRNVQGKCLPIIR